MLSLREKREYNTMECKKIKSSEKNSKDANTCMKNSKELEELNKIKLMRAFVEGQDPSSKEVDDLTLRRFLRNWDLDVEKSSAMFLKYLKWRRDFLPNGSISASEVPNQIAQNKLFLQGSDKKGRPIVVNLAARHFKGDFDEYKRFMVYGFEKTCSRIPPGQEKFIYICDYEGWGYSNIDNRGHLAGLSMMQDYYPERTAKIYMLHTPLMFTTVWKVIRPFLNSRTKKKIVFVDKKMVKSTLLKKIDESQLPEKYGGKLSLVPI